MSDEPQQQKVFPGVSLDDVQPYVVFYKRWLGSVVEEGGLTGADRRLARSPPFRSPFCGRRSPLSCTKPTKKLASLICERYTPSPTGEEVISHALAFVEEGEEERPEDRV